MVNNKHRYTANIIIITSINYYAMALTIFINDTVRSAVNRIIEDSALDSHISLDGDRWDAESKSLARQCEHATTVENLFFTSEPLTCLYCTCELIDHGRKVLLSWWCKKKNRLRKICTFASSLTRFFPRPRSSCRKYLPCKCRSFRITMI